MTNQPNPDQPGDAPHTDGPASTEDTPGAPPSAPPSAPTGTSREPEPTKRSRLTRFLVPVLVGLALIGFKVWNSQTAADRLEVGQCVARESDDGIKAIDCGDAKAEFKILHIAQDSKESAAEQVCGPFAETTTTYYEGKDDGSKGDLICLAPAK